MKLLHELGSYGLVGGLAVQLLLVTLRGAERDLRLVGEITLWVVAPSLLLVILSGVLAMVVRTVYFSKGWVWLKIFLTVPTFYSTLATFPGLAWLEAGHLSPKLWMSLLASVVITFLSVWRPKGLLALR